jgi:hypothetical protein
LSSRISFKLGLPDADDDFMTKRLPSKLAATALALAALTTVGLASNEGPGSVAAVAPVFRQSDVVGDRVTVDDSGV